MLHFFDLPQNSKAKTEGCPPIFAIIFFNFNSISLKQKTRNDAKKVLWKRYLSTLIYFVEFEVEEIYRQALQYERNVLF